MRIMRHIILSVLLATAMVPASAQKLIIEKTTVDVGRTGYQQPITAVFEFRVKGSKKVRIIPRPTRVTSSRFA